MKKVLNQIRAKLLRTPSYIKDYYKKNIVILLLILCVPSLLIGTAIYFFGARHLKDEMIATHKEQINNQVAYIDSQMRSLEVNLSYWSHEKLFRTDLDQINFQDQYQLAEEITGSLFSKQNGNSLIERISLFINSEAPAVFNPQFRWIDQQDLTDYQRYIWQEDAFYWERNYLKTDADDHLFPLALVKNIPSFYRLDDGNRASFIIELNHQAVLQMIDGLSLSSEGFSFIIDKHSGMIISSDEKSSQFFDEVLIHQGLVNGSFTTDWDGTNYSVTSGTISRVNADWLYMSVVPISFITEPINRLSKTIVIISLVGLCLSFSIATMTFRSIYRPIEKILELFKGSSSSKRKDDAFNVVESNWNKLNTEKEVLEDHVHALNEKLISNFFFQLIEGFLEDQSELELRLRLKQYQIELDQHYIVYLDIETINKKQQNSIIKCMEEIFSSSYHVIYFNDHFAGVVFIFSDQTKHEEQLNRLYSIIKEDSKYETTVMYLSQSVQKLTDLTDVVEQIRQKKYKKHVYTETVLITMPATIKTMEKSGDIYPFEKEQQILVSIESADIDQTIMLVNEFITILCEYDDRAIQYSFIQLYGSIQSRILKEGFYPFELFESKNVLKEFMHTYDMDCLKEILIDTVIKPFIKAMQNKSISKQDYLVRKVIDYIHDHYMYDISLEECADELGLNSYTLSKLFKHEKGINFIDYLTTYRLDKAKQLLVETSMKIQEISVAVGYRHSYFNRIFKKQTNMTPGQYRNTHQSLHWGEMSNL